MATCWSSSSIPSDGCDAQPRRRARSRGWRQGVDALAPGETGVAGVPPLDLVFPDAPAPVGRRLTDVCGEVEQPVLQALHLDTTREDGSQIRLTERELQVIGRNRAQSGKSGAGG